MCCLVLHIHILSQHWLGPQSPLIEPKGEDWGKYNNLSQSTHSLWGPPNSRSFLFQSSTQRWWSLCSEDSHTLERPAWDDHKWELSFVSLMTFKRNSINWSLHCDISVCLILLVFQMYSVLYSKVLVLFFERWYRNKSLFFIIAIVTRVCPYSFSLWH